MRLLITLAFALATLSLIWNPGQTSADLRETSPRPQEDLAQELKKVQDRVEKLETEKALLELKVDVHQQLMKEIYDWMATLPQASEALVSSVETARDLGFEAAGPNPKSKTELLNGLKSFARSVNGNNPATKKSQDKKN